MKGLIWFRHDLRLADNPALIALSKHCSQSLMVFIINPEWFKPNHFKARHMGYFRESFLYQSLRELDSDLKKFNQRLIIKVGDPLAIIPKLCQEHGIDLVSITDHPGKEQQQQTEYLKHVLPSKVVISDSFTLFLQHQLGFNKYNFPKNFDQFLQRVSDHNLLPCIPISAPDSLPKIIKEKNDDWRGEDIFQSLPFYQGGEDAAFMKLKQFYWKTGGLQHYKQARDGLEGSYLSSRLSAWLTNGCISPRIVAAELDKYEYRHGRDDSSRAMYNELLRREYFQWSMTLQQPTPQDSQTDQALLQLSNVELNKLNDWQQGNTRFPIINACMRQLNQTGFLSNLGRKIAASCLINELEINWQFGAAYFEQQLIDFDIAANSGNWKSLAGVGTPSKTQYHFNIENQTCKYDPDGKFVARWGESSDDKVLQRF